MAVCPGPHSGHSHASAQSLVLGPGPNRLTQLTPGSQGQEMTRHHQTCSSGCAVHEHPRRAPQSCFTEMAVLEHGSRALGSSLTGEVLPGAQWHTDASKAKLPGLHRTAACFLSANWRRRCRVPKAGEDSLPGFQRPGHIPQRPLAPEGMCPYNTSTPCSDCPWEQF